MGALPVLFVIIAIVNVALNYKKSAEKRIQDQKKRMEKSETLHVVPEKPKETGIGSQPVSASSSVLKPVYQPACAPERTVKIRAGVKDMQKAVIMAEILNKPVSLREK